MKYQLDLDNPVRSLQVMLRNLGKVYTFLPEIAIDGIFGEETLKALTLFQQELYPPATGIVTPELWNVMAKELQAYEEILEPPRSLRAFPEGDILFATGDEKGEIALFQLMFSLLSKELKDIVPETPTGRYSSTLQDNVKWLQQRSALPVTGQLDRQTWGRLARLYELFLTKE